VGGGYRTAAAAASTAAAETAAEAAAATPGRSQAGRYWSGRPLERLAPDGRPIGVAGPSVRTPWLRLLLLL